MGSDATSDPPTYLMALKTGITPHPLNIITEFVTGGPAHVELAIGADTEHPTLVQNVLRIYNGGTAELVHRTDRDSQYTFTALHTTRQQKQRMLAFAREQVNKRCTFSNVRMMRSIILPGQPDGRSWFCAELTVAALQAGGVLSTTLNPSSFTPECLRKTLACRASMAAHPSVLSRLEGKISSHKGDSSRNSLFQPSTRIGSLPKSGFVIPPASGASNADASRSASQKKMQMAVREALQKGALKSPPRA